MSSSCKVKTKTGISRGMAWGNTKKYPCGNDMDIVFSQTTAHCVSVKTCNLSHIMSNSLDLFFYFFFIFTGTVF